MKNRLTGRLNYCFVLLAHDKDTCGPSGKGCMSRTAAGSDQQRKVGNMRIDNIKIFPCFMAHPPKPEKMEHKDRYYQEHGSFESGIILDGSGYLIDGYTSYLLAVKYSVGSVPVAYGRRQIIRAAHWPGGKLYVWELPGILIDRVKIGDRVLVRSGRGVKAVTVAAVEEYGQQAPEPLRMVIRRNKRNSA